MASTAPALSLLALALEAWAQLPDELVSGIVPARRDAGAPAPESPEQRASAASRSEAAAWSAGDPVAIAAQRDG